MNKIMGITDEITSCDCCGRSDLKKTVVISDQDGNINYYGTECAAKLMGFQELGISNKKKVEKEIRKCRDELIKEIRSYYNKSEEVTVISRFEYQLRNNPNVKRELAFKRIKECTEQITNKLIEKFGDALRVNNLKLRDII